MGDTSGGEREIYLVESNLADGVKSSFLKKISQSPRPTANVTVYIET